MDELNRRGIRNRNGKPLGHSSFQRALKNKAYIGQFTYRGEVVEGVAEPLIDEETFMKVRRNG